MKLCALLALLSGLGLAASESALAASLRPDKATDSSVCDLGPNTTEVLGRKILVPASAAPEQAAEAYKRLASRFITASCSDGQLLILHSENNRPIDAKYLPNVAGSLCAVADIVRTEVSAISPISGEHQRGFELRCRITKFGEFKGNFDAGEIREPTEDFIVRLQKQQVPVRNTGSTADGAASQKDCGKMTLASILTGGNCK